MFAKSYTDYKVVDFMAQVTDVVAEGSKYVFMKLTPTRCGAPAWWPSSC